MQKRKKISAALNLCICVGDKMKHWTRSEFIKMIEKNGYYYTRNNGGHSIYTNAEGKHIAVPYNKICAPMAKRLIKENNLNTEL